MYRAYVFAFPPLGHCCVIFPIILCTECWVDIIRWVDATDVVREFVSFSVEFDVALM